MRFAEVVDASERVRSTSGKKEKVRIIAELLTRSRGRETYLLAHYLVGSVPSGKLGIGWKTIQNAMEGLGRSAGPVDLQEVQRFLDDLSTTKGAGSSQQKTRILRQLFGMLKEEERFARVKVVQGGEERKRGGYHPDGVVRV